MKEVQDALRPTGIPAFALAWRSTPQHPTAPDLYIVYTTMTTETEHWDDTLRRYRVYVYLNIWSKTDPTAAKLSVREAMRTAGFALVEESDSYGEETDSYHIASTWLLIKEAESHGA
jgi:hypothetical protein